MKAFLGFPKTQLNVIPDQKGESLEEQLRKALANNEPIEATAPLIYTAKADGVMPEYDPRTDKQEVAIEATDKYAKSEAMKTTDAPQDPASGTETNAQPSAEPKGE